jgi:hypothetical protein
MRGPPNDGVESARPPISLAPALPALLFLAAGILGALFIRPAGSSLQVHLGFVWAAALFSIVGAWAERVVLRVNGTASTPIHLLVIGQIVFVLYFYLRSLLSHALGVPGVSGWELHLLAAAALFHFLRRRRDDPGAADVPARVGAHAALWVLFWASTIAYLGPWSGRLDPPSSDPDAHAFLARLTSAAGRIVYDYAPFAGDRVSYPSAFSVLNALWVDLSGASPVAVVNCQTALQSSFAVGLVLELILLLRPRRGLVLGAVLLALAHWFFALPVNPDWSYLEGTPRLAHKAVALLPLTFATRYAASGIPIRRLRAAGILIGVFCLCWAAVTNPAHLFVEAPIVLGSVLLLIWTEPDPAGQDRGAAMAWACAGAVLLAVLLLASDAWVRSVVWPDDGSGSRANALASGLRWFAALGAGWTQASSHAVLGLFPHGCMLSAQCPPHLALPGRALAVPAYLGAAAALVVLARSRQAFPEGKGLRTASLAVLAVGIAAWTSFFAFGFVPTLFADAPGLFGSLLRSYSRAGIAYSTALLLLCLVGAALSLGASAIEAVLTRRRPGLVSHADALVAGAAMFAVLVAAGAAPGFLPHIAQAHARNLRTVGPSSLGPIGSDDLRLVEEARVAVPSDERVLLPGVVQRMNEWETWYFTVGGARAVPLYGDLKFAFFHGLGSREFTAQAYQDHVCGRFDLAWLLQHRVLWIYDGGADAGPVCVSDWKVVRERDFEEKLRFGARALLRIRPERLPQVKDGIGR